MALSGTPRVATVSVGATRHVSAAAVIAATGLVGRPVFTTSAADARAAVLRLAAVRDAQVRIALPDAAQVDVVERDAVGRWVTGGPEWYVDADGVLFASADPQGAPQLRAIDALRVLTVDENAAGIWFDQPVDHAQRGGLATSRRTDEHAYLAVGNVQ